MSKAKLLLDVADGLHSLADSIRAVAEAISPEPEVQNSTEESSPNEPAITIEDIRDKLGGKPQEAVRMLLREYGATKLSAIDPKHYPALLAEAEVL